MKCEICKRELSPGEGFVRLEAYVVVSKDVFRRSAGSASAVVCVLCHEGILRMIKALLAGLTQTERSESCAGG